MPTPRVSSNVFERWTPIWHFFFYVMIAVSTFLVLNSGDPIPASRNVVLALTGSLTVWHWFMLVRLGRDQRNRPKRVAIYLAGATLVSAVLLGIHPAFLMIAMSLYNQVFAFMVMRWAIPGSIVLTAVIAAMMTRTGGLTTAVAVTVGAVSALVFARFLSASSDESEKRRELIEELERTREQLALAERLAGMTEERHRIARELHDTVTQQLIGIVMHLDALASNEQRFAREPERAKEAVDQSLALARDGLAEARRLVWAAVPEQLETGSLTNAVRAAVDRLSKDAKVESECVLGPEIDALPVSVQSLVLRGVQEALANVRKHARAKRVTVTATAEDDFLAVDIHDDGIGFDPAAAAAPAASSSFKGSGFGLRGLRERVEGLAGTLSIESNGVGGGTAVAFHVPLK
jgi:signal transduction histidine kinase